jgi:hypothetical protein
VVAEPDLSARTKRLPLLTRKERTADDGHSEAMKLSQAEEPSDRASPHEKVGTERMMTSRQ